MMMQQSADAQGSNEGAYADLEPRLTRHGYNVKVLAEVLNVRPREIRSFLQGRLPSSRTQELQHEMLAAGIPL